MARDEQPKRRSDRPGVVVVGPCASGKTTLVANLQQSGVDAWAVSQEHSEVHYLWARRNPDIVVGLDLDLEALRDRRSPNWSAAIYAAQHNRLQDAFAHADIMIDTGTRPEMEVLHAVLELIARFDAASSIQTEPLDSVTETLPPHLE